MQKTKSKNFKNKLTKRAKLSDDRGFPVYAARYFKMIDAVKKGQPPSPEEFKLGMRLLDLDVERLLRKVG